MDKLLTSPSVVEEVTSGPRIRSAVVAESDVSVVMIPPALEAEVEVEVIIGSKEDGKLVIDQEIEKLRADVNAGYVVCLDLLYLKHECGFNQLDSSTHSCGLEFAMREGDCDNAFPASASEIGNTIHVGEEEQQVVSSSDMEKERSRQRSANSSDWDTALHQVNIIGGNTTREGNKANSLREGNSGHPNEYKSHSSTYRGKSTHVPWDRTIFATVGSTYRADSQIFQSSVVVEQNFEKSNATRNLDEKLGSILKLSKERRDEKERERKKEKLKKSPTNTALEGPAKVPNHVKENVDHPLRCVPLPPPGERSQYGMHMVLERFTFFDQICLHFGKDRERKKAIGRER